MILSHAKQSSDDPDFMPHYNGMTFCNVSFKQKFKVFCFNNHSVCADDLLFLLADMVLKFTENRTKLTCLHKASAKGNHYWLKQVWYQSIACFSESTPRHKSLLMKFTSLTEMRTIPKDWSGIDRACQNLFHIS